MILNLVISSDDILGFHKNFANFRKKDKPIDLSIREMVVSMAVYLLIISDGNDGCVKDVFTGVSEIFEQLKPLAANLRGRIKEAPVKEPSIETVVEVGQWLDEKVPGVVDKIRPIVRDLVSVDPSRFGHGAWGGVFFTASIVVFMETWGIDILSQALKTHVENPQMLRQLYDIFGEQFSKEDLS